MKEKTIKSEEKKGDLRLKFFPLTTDSSVLMSTKKKELKVRYNKFRWNNADDWREVSGKTVEPCQIFFFSFSRKKDSGDG